jgi:hypothetical protein
MTTTMNHSNCAHPATKAARAKCRKDRAAHAEGIASEIAALVASYFDNSADGEEIIYALHAIDPAITAPWYAGDATIEDIIFSIR